MAKEKAEEEYVSGEEYQAMSQQSSKPRRQVSLSATTVGLVIAVLVLCGISFAVAENYGKNHPPKAAATAVGGSSSGFRGRGGFRNGGGFGQVTAVSSTSVTIQNARSGASSTFTINSSTTITDNGQTVTASDIQTGSTIIVRVASSGSTTASSIVVNPSLNGGGGGAGGAGSSGGATGQ